MHTPSGLRIIIIYDSLPIDFGHHEECSEETSATAAHLRRGIPTRLIPIGRVYELVTV